MSDPHESIWAELRELRARYKPKSKPKVPLEDAVRMANELGLTYGQFVAKLNNMEGE